MNIGIESDKERIDKLGVSILREKLSKSKRFETHMKDEDKTPNSDGYFIIKNVNKSIPLRRFDCQIKSTEAEPSILKNGYITYQCDTKFLNYANLKVTTDPCIVFYVDIENNKVYYKILTNEYLEAKSKRFSIQNTIAIHFNPIIETLNDLDTFYKTLLNITYYKKQFDINGIDIAEYQKGFDIINEFFNTDFSFIKREIYPSVWKFGVAYQKYEHNRPIKYKIPFISSYDTAYGVYAIDYGDKTLPFQQADVKNKATKLKLIGCTVNTYSIKETVETAMKKWIENYLSIFINNYSYTIPFLPIDAISEILFNFFDMYKNDNKVNHISIDEILKLYQEVNNFLKIDDKIIISSCIKILNRKNIKKIDRVFEKYHSNKNLLSPVNIDIRIRNNEKLFSNIANYYNEFIFNIFGEKYYKSYKKMNTYNYKIEIDSFGTSIKETYSCQIKNSEDWIMKKVESFDDTNDITRCGILETDFRENNFYNITYSLLNLLYTSLCRRFGFEKSPINIKSIFSNF